jgi:hypothetical protein
MLSPHFISGSASVLRENTVASVPLTEALPLLNSRDAQLETTRQVLKLARSPFYNVRRVELVVSPQRKH